MSLRKVGERVVLVRDVERFGTCEMVRAGAHGTVIESRDGFLSVRMDIAVPGLEYYANCLQWAAEDETFPESFEDVETRDAKTERDGFLWFMNRGIRVDNLIFYTHTGCFCFGWRSPIDAELRDALLDVISEFPFPYDLKCNDGKTLSGD